MNDHSNRSTMPASLSQRRRIATRRDIEHAATMLFTEAGYESTTVEQIAARAGISLRTFYRYCRSKDDAIASRLPSGGRTLLAHVSAQRDESLADAIVNGFLEEIAEDDADDDEVRDRLALLASAGPLRARWLAAGRDAQEQLATLLEQRKASMTRLQTLTVAGAIVAALTTALETWARREHDSLEDAVRECMSAVRIPT